MWHSTSSYFIGQATKEEKQIPLHTICNSLFFRVTLENVLYPLTFLQRAEGKLVNIWQLCSLSTSNEKCTATFIFCTLVSCREFVTRRAITSTVFYFPNPPFSVSKYKLREILTYYRMYFNFLTQKSHIDQSLVNGLVCA